MIIRMFFFSGVRYHSYKEVFVYPFYVNTFFNILTPFSSLELFSFFHVCVCKQNYIVNNLESRTHVNVSKE